MDTQRFKSARIYFLLAMVLFTAPTVLGFYKGHTGRILVATERLNADPHFSQTVIYVFGHSVWGAQGVILNRPRPSPDLKEYLFKGQDVEFYQGGPVSFPAMRFVAVDRLRAVSHWRTQPLFVVRYEAFKKMFPEQVERGFNVYLDYTGWSAGQLEKEIHDGAWIVVDNSAEVLESALRQGAWGRLSKKY